MNGYDELKKDCRNLELKASLQMFGSVMALVTFIYLYGQASHTFGIAESVNYLCDSFRDVLKKNKR